MNKNTKKLIKSGAALGMKALSVTEMVLLELEERSKDLSYLRRNSCSSFGGSVRIARERSEEIQRLHDLKMKRRSIERLKRQKYITLRAEGERVICELTTKGRIRTLRSKIKFSPDYSDGSICLVVFDFPMGTCTARRYFRRVIKAAGFEFVQGSVWSSAKDVKNEIQDMVDLLKIGKWIKVYEARR